MPASTASARFAPAPSGHALAPDELGRVDDEHVGIGLEVLLERDPRAAQQQRVAGSQPRLVLERLAASLHREHDEVAAVREHARVDARADESRAWRDDHLGEPRLARDERVRVGLELVLARERPRMPAEVGRDRLAVAVRQQPLAEEDDDRDRADHERHADEREVEVPERLHPGVLRRGVHDHVDRRARQGEQRAGVGAEGERQQELRRGPTKADREQRRPSASAPRPSR